MNMGNIRSLVNLVGAEGFEPRPPAPKAGALATRLRYAPLPNEDRYDTQFSLSVNLHFTNLGQLLGNPTT